MNASLIVYTDPFRQHVGSKAFRVRRRTRIDTLLRRHGFIEGRGKSMRRLRNFVVTDGPNSGVMEADWGRTIEDNECVSFVAFPAGGSSLRTVAMVAVMVVATYFTAGGAAAGFGASSAAFGSGTFGAAALGAAVAVGGSLVGKPYIPQESNA